MALKEESLLKETSEKKAGIHLERRGVKKRRKG